MTRNLFVACNLFAALALVGCADTNDDAEEDAAADAHAGGKSDEAGFETGLFTNTDYEYDAKEPVNAVFHAADADLPDGESGYFDLARSVGDYEFDYNKGTFKLYTYQGRNRIRFTTDEGRVILRSDWKLDDGILRFAESQELARTTKLPEELVDCLAVEIIDSNIFEEGLSVNEYPDVSVDKEGTSLTMDMGAASLSSDAGTITIDEGARRFEAVGTYSDSPGTYVIRVPNKSPRRGEILHAEGSGTPTAIATIACR